MYTTNHTAHQQREFEYRMTQFPVGLLLVIIFFLYKIFIQQSSYYKSDVAAHPLESSYQHQVDFGRHINITQEFTLSQLTWVVD